MWVTPGAIVTLTVPLGHINAAEPAAKSPVDVTPPTLAESEVKPPSWFDNSSWWVLMGNLENNQLVSLGKVSNAGPPGAKPQTCKLQIQAPPNAGSWKFYALVKNDSNMGCDLTIEMTLTVIDAPELSAEIIEDDTSAWGGYDCWTDGCDQE
ncbi:hypothetical protein HDU78_010741 [Chytriomyces hyalinus]|nr:hypothetical protein HDU78_010741 [Chytriomyces hyalinus]